MDRIPLILYGDGPRLHSGLARIARDLAVRIVAEQESLGVRFAQVGVDYPGGWQWQPWDFCGFQPTPQDQGRDAVAYAVEELKRETGHQPIVFMIMDPARCWDLTRLKTVTGWTDTVETERLACQFWGYYPLDSHNLREIVGGPAALAIHDTDRLLGYGRYGASLLKRMILSDTPKPVSYLPHGIDTHTFKPGWTLESTHADFQAWAAGVPAQAIKLGCVSTNQPRKDLGLLFQTVAALKDAGHPVAIWLHSDVDIKYWSIPELVVTCGLTREEVAFSTAELTDQQLAAQYCWSDCTIAPGLGEGFGYPIVESLACGTPVVHARYAGGVELIPHPRWLIDPVAWRLESVYTLLRPVVEPAAMAKGILDLLDRRDAALAAYCSGAVAHLDWRVLWPRWRSWLTQGLANHREPQKEPVRG